MTTLYIRDVPPSVAATLKERAAARGQSLSVYVADELTRLASRPTNYEIAARLRDKNRGDGPTADDILAALDAGRQ